MHDILLAFTLTMLAGLSTGIGSCIAFVARHTNKRFLSVSLGFSAGVMIYVSFIEIFSQAQQALVSQLGQTVGSWATAAAFFGGMLANAVLDRLIPSQENPHEPKRVEAENEAPARDNKLMRMGVFTALAIALHNFPEGLAAFVSAMQGPSIAIPIVMAIAIHNIPEGMAVGLACALAASAESVPGGAVTTASALALALGIGLQNFPEGAAISLPLRREGLSRTRSFVYGARSGIVEPIGGVLAVLVAGGVQPLMPWFLSFAAGAMIYVVVEELIPESQTNENKDWMALFTLVGFSVMMVMDVALG